MNKSKKFDQEMVQKLHQTALFGRPSTCECNGQIEKDPDIQIINDGPWAALSLDQIQGDSAWWEI